MPSIFSEEDRLRIRSTLLSEGRQMMLSQGITGMNLQTLSQTAGIAKGTFYHFFPSKQRFIMEIIRNYQREKLDHLQSLAAEKQNCLSLEEGLQWYQSLLQRDNPLMYIGKKDMEWILEKIPASEIFDRDLDQKTCRLIFSCIRDLRPDLDYRVLSNFPKIIMFARMQREYTHQEVLDQNLRMIKDTMIQYIRGETE